MKTISNRLLAVKTINSLASDKGSLSSLLSDLVKNNPDANLPLIREYTYGVCRWYYQLCFVAKRLMKKPLRKKDNDIHCLILLGIYQMYHMRTPDHATINETVALTRLLKKDWARGLVNAVLRSAQREQEALQLQIEQDQCALTAHPPWLITALENDWPDTSLKILDQNNLQAPMTLRVNLSLTNQDDYLTKLQHEGHGAMAGKHSDAAIILNDPADVMQLPGFQDGLVSVQDEASQLCAALLHLEDGAKVLDACAAPGGKTCALLERHAGKLDMLALDNSEARLKRVRENLTRLKLPATITCADASVTDSWWNGNPLDAILLDAPCSGTGVIRRHPDIKLLRHAEDIPRLMKIQQELLLALWPCLKKGGKFLYSTCSVLRDENEHQISAFISNTDNARAIPINNSQALPCSVGMQFLPGNDKLDGFYYALLEKY